MANTIRVTVEGSERAAKAIVAKIVALSLGSTPGVEVMLKVDGVILKPEDIDVTEKQGTEVLGGSKVHIDVLP